MLYPFAEVNWLAVIVAALANMIIGTIWYSPGVLGKTWMNYIGMTEAKMKEKGGASKMAQSMLLGFLTSIITAFVISQIISVQGEFGVHSGLISALIVWLGFAMPVHLGGVLWEMRPWGLFFLNSASNLISLLAMGAIIGAWV